MVPAREHLHTQHNKCIVTIRRWSATKHNASLATCTRYQECLVYRSTGIRLYQLEKDVTLTALDGHMLACVILDLFWSNVCLVRGVKDKVRNRPVLHHQHARALTALHISELLNLLLHSMATLSNLTEVTLSDHNRSEEDLTNSTFTASQGLSAGRGVDGACTQSREVWLAASSQHEAA